MLAVDGWWGGASCVAGTHLLCGNGAWPGIKFGFLLPTKKIFPTSLHSGFGASAKASARRNFVKKLRRDGEAKKTITLQTNKNPSDESNGSAGESSPGAEFSHSTDDNLDQKNTIPSPSRSVVLQACTITSGLILALGVVIRQASHIAFMEGWPLHDCSTEVSFDFELWHLELITGLVVMVSLCRYLLLKTWPDFAESSEAANQQVLSSLQPLDYMVVAFLPGVSEEFLFRGALLPLFGLNWKSALVVAVIFGVLHLGSGRRYSFAIWAIFVGLAYGYATIVSSSIIVPMVSHSLNNLIGGILWNCTNSSSEEI